MADIYSWQDSMGCPTVYRQIEQDLRPFKVVDMDKSLSYAAEKFKYAGSYSFCNYVVLNNQVWKLIFFN